VGSVEFFMICCGSCELHCITVLASELGLLTLFLGDVKSAVLFPEARLVGAVVVFFSLVPV
jgi:hypothetical protein